MQNNNNNLKGFRQTTSPTKGQVQQENVELSQKLQQQINAMKTQFQFIANILNSHALSQRENKMAAGSLLSVAATKEVLPDVVTATGDHLMVDYLGCLVKEDGTPEVDADGLPLYFDGGYASRFIIESLGSQTLIPGFEDQLLNRKAGDTFDVNVQFPENYQEKSVAGKRAKFLVTLHKIYRPLSESTVEKVKREHDEAKKQILVAKQKAQQEAEAAKKAADQQATQSEGESK